MEIDTPNDDTPNMCTQRSSKFIINRDCACVYIEMTEVEYDLGAQAQAGHDEMPQDPAQLRKRGRENTIEEKRRMRKNRKKRQRKRLRTSTEKGTCDHVKE